MRMRMADGWVMQPRRLGLYGAPTEAICIMVYRKDKAGASDLGPWFGFPGSRVPGFSVARQRTRHNAIQCPG
uniref:HDC13005 n=1 Tax=Drosophila melanogaster TaxID=7227 RepID=Q6IKA9_DROME|nr:TPA_inf: HDC13005 [Drosophila melanogaster]